MITRHIERAMARAHGAGCFCADHKAASRALSRFVASSISIRSVGENAVETQRALDAPPQRKVCRFDLHALVAHGLSAVRAVKDFHGVSLKRYNFYGVVWVLKTHGSMRHR
jgi:hypothetical protein